MEYQYDGSLPRRSLEVSETLLHGGLDSSQQEQEQDLIRIHNTAAGTVLWFHIGFNADADKSRFFT
jgi:hypothetical protein